MGDIDVLQIVTSYLVQHGYDGLVAADAECGCLVGSLAPCVSAYSGVPEDCVAGHRVDIPRGQCEEHGDGCRWHVVAGKRPARSERTEP